MLNEENINTEEYKGKNLNHNFTDQVSIVIIFLKQQQYYTQLFSLTSIEDHRFFKNKTFSFEIIVESYEAAINNTEIPCTHCPVSSSVSILKNYSTSQLGY